MLKQKEIQDIKEQLILAKKIVIISHYNPDGDAIGSSLALYHFYKSEGYDAKVILPNPFPDFLKWIPGSDDIIIGEKNLSEARRLLKEAEILFIVDMNAAHRTGEALENAIIKSNAFKILIDHHINPDIECNAKLSMTKASSTCELVYRYLYDYMKVKTPLTKTVAACMYVGIITDTGSLTYSCNDPKTYLILSKLIKAGVDGEQIHRLVYDNYEESRIHLLGLSLKDRLKVMPHFATAYMSLSQQDLINNHYKIGDTEGFVNYGLCMRSVQFAVIFIQRENRIRISFRSKGNFDVNLFARKHFNGGGHKNASAAYHQDTLENTIAYFESLLPQYEEELLRPYKV